MTALNPSRHHVPVVLPPARKSGRPTLGVARPFLYRQSAGSERVLYKAGVLVFTVATVASLRGWTVERFLRCGAAVLLVIGSVLLLRAGRKWAERS